MITQRRKAPAERREDPFVVKNRGGPKQTRRHSVQAAGLCCVSRGRIKDRGIIMCSVLLQISGSARKSEADSRGTVQLEEPGHQSEQRRPPGTLPNVAESQSLISVSRAPV